MGAETFAQQEGVELADGREPARGGAAREAVCLDLGEVVPDLVGRGRLGAGVLAGERGDVVLEVAAVGGERILRGAPLCRHHLEEAADEDGNGFPLSLP